MKHLISLFLIVFIFSCGSSKNAIKDPKKELAKVEVKNEPEIEVKKDNIEPEVVEVSVDNNHLESQEATPPAKDSNVQQAKETPKSAFNHELWSDLLKKHVSNSGLVNYKGFREDSSSLRQYIMLLGAHLPSENWSREEKLAYWINAYNAMTVDLITRHYPLKSIRDINKPWEQRLWKLGDKWYNLDEIEHRILRKMNEPRIHFAIVCASYSCPKLMSEAFSGFQLEEQLIKATKDFLSDPAKNNITANTLKLSKIFNWFAKDFKQEGTLIDFLNKYADVEISRDAKKSFKDYNWSLNE